MPFLEASLHPDGGCYLLKDGEAPAQSMRSQNLRHIGLLATGSQNLA